MREGGGAAVCLSTSAFRAPLKLTPLRVSVDDRDHQIGQTKRDRLRPLSASEGSIKPFTPPAQQRISPKGMESGVGGRVPFYALGLLRIAIVTPIAISATLHSLLEQ